MLSRNTSGSSPKKTNWVIGPDIADAVRMARRVLLLLCIVFWFASCGISKTSGTRLSYGDKSTAHLPRKVVAQLCQSDPALKPEMIDVLSRNLTDAGIEVVNNPGSPNDMAIICSGGTLSEAMRKDLLDSFNIDGLFIGTLEQRRVEPFHLTRFELKLIGNPSGRLIWITNAKTDQPAWWADARTTAAKTIAIAIQSFEEEFSGNSKGTRDGSEKNRRR